MLKSQNGGNYVGELLCIHFSQQRIRVDIEIERLVFAEVVEIQSIVLLIVVIAIPCVNGQHVVIGI